MSEITLVSFYTLLIALFISKTGFFRLEGIPKRWVLFAFLTKIVASAILYLIYTRYYPDRSTADIFRYFDDSKVLYHSLWEKPLDFIRMLFGTCNNSPHFDYYYQQMNNWYSIYPSSIYGDGHLMIRLNTVIRLFSFGYYSVHALMGCLLSFIGLIGFYKVVARKMKDNKLVLFILLFFFPSLTFWTSALLKEGLILCCLGLIIYLIDLMVNTKCKLHYCLLLALLFLVLGNIKFYVFLFILPLSFSYYWNEKSSPGSTFLKYIIPLTILFITGIVLGRIFPVYDISHILARKQQDFLQLAIMQNSGSIVKILPIEENFTSVVRSIVPGFVNTFTLPYPCDIRKITYLIPALENMFLALFVIISLIWHKKSTIPSLFYLSLFFFILTFTVIGMISPVIGAIIRYKVIALPFYFTFILLVWDKNKTINSIFRR